MNGKSDIVAIIDDDRVFQKITWMKITRKNYARKVLMFSDGEQAMRFISDNAGKPDELPDIILLDLNMPVMDGWDFMDAFVKIKPFIGKTITIFVATSSVNPEDQRRAIEVSAVSDYVIKPISDASLNKLFTPLCKEEAEEGKSE
ncbi:MAG: response regulator [Opitutales bacterium]|nr:response regulator [Opitutales bacterium]